LPPCRCTVLRVPSSLGGTPRRYKIVVDGEVRAHLAGGEEIELQVEAGEHVVEARIDWTGSSALIVDVPDGETASLAIEPVAQSHLGQFKTVPGRHGFLRLRLVQ
jgi:hypothetical protein